jgi:hypothetical protein
VSYRLLVSCDSNPAPYAGGANWPCRAWLTVPVVPEIDEQAALIVAAGWTVDRQGHRCPACTRLLAASRS